MISAKQAKENSKEYCSRLLFKNPKKRNNLIKKILNNIECDIIYCSKKGRISTTALCYLVAGVFVKYEQVMDIMTDIIKILETNGFKVELYGNTGLDISWDI